MTADEFTAWASLRGLPPRTTVELIHYAATPDEMREAVEAMLPAPPIFSLDDVVDMTDNAPDGHPSRKDGFIVVGGCPNGDFVAVDVRDEPGSVWYISHELLWERPVRKASVRVAQHLTEMVERMLARDFPLDCFDAENL